MPRSATSCPCRSPTRPANDRDAGDLRIELRIVGVATFPPVNQIGTDVPRLGVGALVTRGAYRATWAEIRPTNPSSRWCAWPTRHDPARVIARIPDGFQDAAHTTTTWFTGTKPAEIRQLDAAMPYLRASLVVGYAVLLAVITHALWTRVRTNRHALAVLRAVGCTSRQLNAIAAWQALPAALAAIFIGIPRRHRPRPPGRSRSSHTRWPSSTTRRQQSSTVGALVAAVLAAAAIANIVSLILSPPSRASLGRASSSRGPSPAPG